MKKAPSGISPIITIDKKDSKPLYQQVCESYRQAILDGNLGAGQRVPSTRVLADELGISRIPVLTAYSQLLAEGYFESRVGSGTIVSRSLPGRSALVRSRSRKRAKLNPDRRPVSKASLILSSTSTLYRPRGWGAFALSQIAFDHFPFRIWNRLVTHHCRSIRAASLDYGDPMGSEDLRNAIAVHLRTARGVRCEAEQIMIVSGTQEALDISVRVLLDPGDSIWIEEPCYRLTRALFGFCGCRGVPVPVDSEGLNVAAGMKRCRNARAALVTPSHHYPLGVTMSASRRVQLLDWAEKCGSWIIEDDYDSEYRYESMPITSLQGLDPNSRVIYMGTFSKVLFPSLRLGYLVVPADLVGHFAAARLASKISPPGFFQLVLADFIREGHFARHIRRMRSVYSERRDVLVNSINLELGSEANVVGEQAGLHLSVILKGISDVEIAEQASLENLWLLPLSPFYRDSPNQKGFVLGFGSTSTKEIPRAVRKMRDLLRRMKDGAANLSDFPQLVEL